MELTEAMMDYVDKNLSFLRIDFVHDFVNRAIRFIAVNEDQYYEASRNQSTQGMKFRHIDSDGKEFIAKESLRNIILKIASNEDFDNKKMKKTTKDKIYKKQKQEQTSTKDYNI